MERWYWTHPDVFEAEVEVVAVEPGRIKAAPILFHPEEGGQPADKGTVGEAVVCDVRVVGGEIVLALDRPLADGRYLARLDREHRLHTATQHTAQHILSGIAAGRFGLETVGVHIGADGCTVDFQEKIGWDTALDLEQRSLEIIMQDMAVETTFDAPDAEIRSRLGPIEADVIRVVKIGECDTSACCGAHVRTTGRIGFVRIFDLENRRNGTRVSFLAGKKALDRSQFETSVLRDLRGLAACATADLPSMLQKAIERSKELTKELTRVWSLRLSDLARTAEVVTVESSPVGIYVGELPRELVTTLAGMIAEAVGGAGIVLSDTHIAVSSSGLSASDLFGKIRSHAGGKGGGSAKSANGRLDKALTAQELREIISCA